MSTLGSISLPRISIAAGGGSAHLPATQAIFSRITKVALLIIASALVGRGVFLLGYSFTLAVAASTTFCLICALATAIIYKKSLRLAVSGLTPVVSFAQAPTHTPTATVSELVPVRARFTPSHPIDLPFVNRLPKQPALPAGPRITFVAPTSLIIRPIKKVALTELMRASRSSPADIPENLVGVQSIAYLRRFQIELLPSGTPGVNLSGSDEIDQANVRARIEMIRKVVMPHAHTKESQASYDKWLWELDSIALGIEDRDKSLSNIAESHFVNKEAMLKRHGRQLKVSVIGGGPIGLAAVLMFFKLGYQVTGYEQYSDAQEGEEKDGKEVFEKHVKEHGARSSFAERRQPFSLVRQSYWLLNGLGLQNLQILDAFGVKRRRKGVCRGPLTH